MGTDDDTVGCANSWPIGDPAKWNSEFATCRCNQRPFAYSQNEKPDHKCGGCEEGETCHKSWPFFKKNVPWSEKEFRCKGPLEAPEEETFEEPALPEEPVIEEVEEPIVEEVEEPIVEDVCVNTDNGVTDRYDTGCDWYATNLWACGEDDTAEFKAYEMCCACSEEKARVDDYYNTCEENEETTDSWGDSCSNYIGNEEWCGGYDDEDFNAFEDCCACK